MVKNKYLYSELYGSELKEKKLVLPKNLFKLYEKLFDYYLEENTLPSIAIDSRNHINILKEIEVEILSIFNRIEENEPLPKEIRDIISIGVIYSSEEIIITPINPIMISYNLQKSMSLLNSEEIPREQILSTLNPEYLLPYIKINGIQYRSNYSENIPRWIVYKKLEDRNISKLGKNIIRQRIDDYYAQYKYLFTSNRKLSINIGVINVRDQSTFFESILQFMLDNIKKSTELEELNPINIYFDFKSYELDTLFTYFYDAKHLDDLQKKLNIKIDKKHSYTDYEVLDILKKSINIYQLDSLDYRNTNINFHITFYQAQELKEINKNKFFNLFKNYSLNGLLNYPQFTKSGNNYVNGFGLGGIDEGYENNLIEIVTLANSIVAAMQTDVDIYDKTNNLVNYIPSLSYSELKPIIDNSNWVTFLNLDVDLSYFFDEKKQDTLVIHYTDQSTTSNYESVTVTNQINQYGFLIEEILPELTTNHNNFNTKQVIKNFNIINGQWLLKLVSGKRINNINYLREKLSIISSYKTMLALLNHKSFIWVPISLEEILRVSGMVGLSSNDGLFSTKNLGTKGETSDDLLFVGIESLYNLELRIHFLPIEVKVGLNKSVDKKAKRQINKTYDILMENLSDLNEDEFMRKYYLNFFVSIAISNLEKMRNSGLYHSIEDKEYMGIKNRLITGKYRISKELFDIYGKGIIYKFTQGKTIRTFRRDNVEEICTIEVPESDAYTIVSESFTKLKKDIDDGKYDFPNSAKLSNTFVSNLGDIDNISEEDIPYETDKLLENYTNQVELDKSKQIKNEFEIINSLKNEYNLIEEEKDNLIEEEKERMPINTSKKDYLRDKRLLIGSHKYSNRKIYWEYGNKNLSNRHLIITGKSGQGKTYFIQTLLSELSKSNISSLIIDYTDGFLDNHLESDLLSEYGDKIETRIIYLDKLPINPFKRQKIKIGSREILETVDDMVARIEQSLDYVFNLGIQQKTVLSMAIKEDIYNYPDNYNFAILADNLVSSDDKSKINLYGRIRPLLEQDRFSYDSNFDWASIFDNSGKIYILQFSKISSSVQQVMIEFLLWDILEYAKSGDETKPLPIILDEIQNLRFTSDSPVVKILREGRKFGLSGIFATQSLSSIKGSDVESIYNAAEQIHFLPTDNQVSEISKMISFDKQKKNMIEEELMTLKKGEALVYGPILDSNGYLTPPEVYSVKIDSFDSRSKE